VSAVQRPKPLPRKIAVRLRDLPRHFRALRENLDAISFEQYRSASTSGGHDELTRFVYPIEQPFEIVDNYIAELTQLGLTEMGLPNGDAPTNLRQLEGEGAISRNLRRKLGDIHRVRNETQHDYPDVRAKVIYAAAGELASEALRFLTAYLRWLEAKGYGKRA
jgi:hypothetical protein